MATAYLVIFIAVLAYVAIIALNLRRLEQKVASSTDALGRNAAISEQRASRG